jgi:hypothetical protein
VQYVLTLPPHHHIHKTLFWVSSGCYVNIKTTYTVCGTETVDC